MVWHYDHGMEIVAVTVVVQAVLEDGVSGWWRKWGSVAFAECDEDESSWFLVVGEIATVVVFSF